MPKCFPQSISHAFSHIVRDALIVQNAAPKYRTNPLMGIRETRRAINGAAFLRAIYF